MKNDEVRNKISPVFKSHDQSGQIKNQYAGHKISMDQSEAVITCDKTELMMQTMKRTMEGSRDLRPANLRESTF